MSVVIQGFPSNGSYIKSDILGYKSYAALFSQKNTEDPVVYVRENDLGFDLTWTRNGAGNYVCSFPTLIAPSKLYITGFGTWANSGNTYLPLMDGSPLGFYTIYPRGLVAAPDGLVFEVVDTGGNQVDLSDLIGFDNPVNFSGVYIEFRIYN